jgi:predicted Zn-dependent protease
MLDDMQNRDELARVVGHELGHIKNNCRDGRNMEMKSDEVAVTYLEKAGYNRCKAAEYLRRRNAPRSWSHPSDEERVKRALNCHWINSTN